ncbi:phosphodiester glycosidase family protein [Paenibacillus solani]|uniref:Metallophosphoesterase n=1 Tax=Paenibacillus solani TaxID=1705565 RepID=A0A0M1P0W5_9BACL|nr:phosphodiester glycosidase family protein [Paenibacillus solani]KOR88022.1 metallophosphoesterase [Paenibacillus solani]
MFRNKKKISSLLSGVMFLSLLFPTGLSASSANPAASPSVIDMRQTEIGPGATYTWANMKKGSGEQKIHMVEFHSSQGNLELQPGLTDGKVYGMQGVSSMASAADKEGNRVIAAVNGDFYDMSTGIPLGLFMGDGEFLTDPPNGRLAFGIKKDGTTLFGSPKLTKNVSIGGTLSSLSSINRLRGTDALVLYTEKFQATTMTNNLGDEVILDIVSGRAASGETMTMRVASILKDQGNSSIGKNQVVLSASGSQRNKLAGLNPGDEVTATFAFEEAWKDVTMAIGGNVMLVQDGAVQQHTDPAIHPRTVVGTKADGSVVLFEVDGRQPGFSEGLSYMELGEMLKELGVVNALNLDGGGSATFVARLPGESMVKVLNSPSDGGERKTANGILLVNKALEGAANKLVVAPTMERVLTGSSATFKAAAVDENLHPARMTESLMWSIDPVYGTIDSSGTLKTGELAGLTEIAVQSGNLTGTAKVEVVDELTELRFPDVVKTLSSGSKETLKVIALRNGQVVQADNNRLEWRTEGEIGTIDGNGVITATDKQDVSGKIFVKYGQVEASMDVNVGIPPVMLEDFENGLDRYLPSAGAQYKSTKVSIETDETYIRSGNGALKLEYDFTGTTGTSGAYLQAKEAGDHIEIPGYPEKISMWVYGDGNGHWLRAQIYDSKGNIPLDFTDQSIGVDFKGWKYLEASVPKGRTLPLKMDMPVRYMEPQAAKKDAGVIYVDEIRALYGPADDDIDPPVLKKFSPADGEEIKVNTPTITVYAEDAGYDPEVHPGTTLIDPDRIRFYLDGSLVQHTLYPPEGKIYYTPSVPLADGVHQAKVTVRDLSGNQTTEEWHFTVNTDAAKVVYGTPDTVYAGGSYTVDISGVKTSLIHSGHLEFQFDLTKVENLQLIPGDKLSPSQISVSIDPTTGKVRVTWKDIHAASLQDTDWIGQIRYDVKKNATGSSIISLTSGGVSFADTGNTEFSFYGLPLNSQIATHYALSWSEEGAVQGYETEFSVTDAQGQPVEGAMIMADGAAVGTTDAAGILKTGTLTSQVKTYEVQAVKNNQYSPALEFKVSPLAGSPIPTNISVGMGEDPTTSRMLNWHTDPATEHTVVELAKQSEFTDFAAGNIQKFVGTSELYHTLDLGTVRVHKATAAGLEPDTEYVYRVGDGQGHYSTQGSFRTTEVTGDTTKFLYFADSQASSAKEFELWGKTIDKAAAEHPDAEFMVHAGDMVDKGFLEAQWNYWFEEAQKHFLHTTLVSAIGNHEVMGTKENGDFLAHFNQPGNGLESLKGTNFSFDYKNIHFIMLNSEYQLEDQKKWLQQDLASNDKDWTIAMFHRGPYGSIYDSAEVRSLWAPVLEEFGVDLVLNGHDHIYIRTFPMMNNQIAADGIGSTYVVAGSSGPKFYSHTERGWHEVVDDEPAQMYASVEVKGDELHFVTKTIGGRVVDEFTLTRSVMKPKPERLIINPDQLSLAVSESHPLSVQVKPSGAERTVVWSVYQSEPAEDVVSVSVDGIVSAQNIGSAVVRATSTAAPEVYADVLITVDRVPEGSVESITLNGRTELKVGDTDQTVTEAVYSDGSRIRLIDGITYESSKPEVASIDEQGLVLALAEGATVISATYEGFKSVYDLKVRMVDGSNPGPEPPVTPPVNPPVQPPVNPPVQPPVTPPVIPPVTPPIAPPVSPPSGSIALSASELAAKLSNGQAILMLNGNFTDITLPGNAADILKKNGSLRIEASNMAITIPAEVLRQVGGLAEADQLEKGTIKLSAATLSNAELKQRITQAARVSSAKLTAAGDVLEFQLQRITADGQAFSLTEFAQPIMLELPLPTDAGGKRISMYYISDNGALEYIDGMNKDGRIIGKIRHFSAYGLLNYEKIFADVKASFWAADVISELAAKQLIEGVSMERFAPARQVTRAEFAAMLVRLLDLRAESSAPFDDVSSGKWYAKAVVAAAQSGIVNGTSTKHFDPETPIKRQEMAAMLVRAYAHAKNQPQGDSRSGSEFADLASSPEWAREAVETAHVLGLVEGHTPNRFEPEGLTTRAESAQVIYNLLHKLK